MRIGFRRKASGCGETRRSEISIDTEDGPFSRQLHPRRLVVDNLVILVLCLYCDRGYDYREGREESLREVAGVSHRAVIVYPGATGQRGVVVFRVSDETRSAREAERADRAGDFTGDDDDVKRPSTASG